MDAVETFVTFTKFQVALVVILLVILAVPLYYLRDFLARFRMRRKRKRIMRQPIRNEAYGDERVDISKKGTFASDNQWIDGSGPIILESITIRNFKCINELDVDFTLASELAGNWPVSQGSMERGRVRSYKRSAFYFLATNWRRIWEADGWEERYAENLERRLMWNSSALSSRGVTGGSYISQLTPAALMKTG